MDSQLIPGIVVHGGAGAWPDGRVDSAVAGCRAAAQAGLEILAAGGSALDAVQAAVRLLEQDDCFNAGLGSVLTRAGSVEVDAAIMDGRSQSVGAIAAASGIDRPVDVARAVLANGEHALLCGEGATAFAVEHGFERCGADALVTERSKRRLAAVAAQRKDDPDAVATDPGTVGAVAVDADGHVAAATSTGGTTYKRPGRIGDTPLAGCGTYAADAEGAASATGDGEAIIRATMTARCCEAMRGGLTAADAATAAVAHVQQVVPGADVGIIVVDPAGGLGAAHCSKRMAWAQASVGQVVAAGIEC